MGVHSALRPWLRGKSQLAASATGHPRPGRRFRRTPSARSLDSAARPATLRCGQERRSFSCKKMSTTMKRTTPAAITNGACRPSISLARGAAGGSRPGWDTPRRDANVNFRPPPRLPSVAPQISLCTRGQCIAAGTVVPRWGFPRAAAPSRRRAVLLSGSGSRPRFLSRPSWADMTAGLDPRRQCA